MKLFHCFFILFRLLTSAISSNALFHNLITHSIKKNIFAFLNFNLTLHHFICCSFLLVLLVGVKSLSCFTLLSVAHDVSGFGMFFWVISFPELSQPAYCSSRRYCPLPSIILLIILVSVFYFRWVPQGLEDKAHSLCGSKIALFHFIFLIVHNIPFALGWCFHRMVHDFSSCSSHISEW